MTSGAGFEYWNEGSYAVNAVPSTSIAERIPWALTEEARAPRKAAAWILEGIFAWAGLGLVERRIVAYKQLSFEINKGMKECEPLQADVKRMEWSKRLNECDGKQFSAGRH